VTCRRKNRDFRCAQRAEAYAFTRRPRIRVHDRFRHPVIATIAVRVRFLETLSMRARRACSGMSPAMGRTRSVGCALVACVALVAACGSNRSNFDDGNGGNGSSGSSGNGFDGKSPDAATSHPAIVGWLHGKVVAPEGTVPVSQAMVYLTSRDVETIPDGAYCDTCVHLLPTEPYAYTKPDGTFELGAYATGKQHIVVQKGQFRRVRDVDVTTGDQNVVADYTRLPGKNDGANGDTIPKIAMVVGGYDHIDWSMKKLGIEEFYRYGDGPIDIGGPPPGIKTNKTGNDLMNVYGELAKHHIVLLPCAAMGATEDDQTLEWTCGAPTSAQKTAFTQYVEAGGKMYVTDFAYEAVRQTWPGFITFYDRNMTPLTSPSQGVGSGCRSGAEDTTGTPQDKGLGDWLTAIGDPSVQLQASWSRMQKVNAQPGFDATGKAVTITPKVWMTSEIDGEQLPATVSFQQRCGRVLFSTYHCEGDTSGGLLAQEKALLYILLEVGVCVGDLPPPPPPR
jgi:hypothetical protein